MGRLLFLLLIIKLNAWSQQGEWTWMKGGFGLNTPAIYGVQGVPSAFVNPPGAYESAEWTDQSGKFWLFGGVRYPINEVFNDLWMYDPGTNMWTWVKGSGVVNSLGVYGTEGLSDPVNNPGGRGWGVASWVDNTGMFWLFGGLGKDMVGSTQLNDLWMYDPNINEWTWMNGSSTGNQAGVYGTKGISDAANSPGSRYETNATWVDDNNHLWLFGGLGLDITGSAGQLNDLWMYDIANNEWTWVSGDSLRGSSGSYGTKGVESSTNVPRGKVAYAHWKDLEGNFWQFAGGFDLDLLNDLWKYNPQNNMWTWMSGSDQQLPPGKDTTYCLALEDNIPEGRYENRSCWTDSCGNFWTFAGSSEDGWAFNDLWHYNVITNKWALISGSTSYNQDGVYGTMGVSDPANIPGARTGNVSWMDNAGNLWTYGGTYWDASGSHNDLWRFVIDPACPGLDISVNPDTGIIICQGESAELTAAGGYEFLWTPANFLDKPDSSVVIATPDSTTTFHVTIASGRCAVTDSVVITVNPRPVLDLDSGSVCLNDSVVLDAGNPGSNYNWSTGETTQTISVDTNGSFNVIVANLNGCISEDSAYIELVSLPVLNINPDYFCAGDSVQLDAGTMELVYLWSTGDTLRTIYVDSVGLYWVTVTDSNGCSANDTVFVQSFNKPVVTLDSAFLCAGDSVAIDAGFSGQSYLWSPGGDTTQVIYADIGGEYLVLVTDSNGCSDSDTAHVISFIPPVVSLDSAFFCTGDSVLLDAGTTAQNYLWQPDSATTQTIFVASEGVVSVMATDINGCIGSDSTLVSQLSPAAIALTDTSLCMGQNVTLDGGISGLNYLWLPDSLTSQSIVVDTTGMYILTISDSAGCLAGDTALVTIHPLPTAIALPDTTIASGESVQLIGEGGIICQWIPATGLDDPFNCNPTATPDKPRQYCLIVTDQNGCKDSTCITVLIEDPFFSLYIPNAFTPNQDGINDLFEIKGRLIADFRLLIFDRWGELIFESNNISNSWDGKVFGKKIVQEDSYIYSLKATDPSGNNQEYVGRVTVIK